MMGATKRVAEIDIVFTGVRPGEKLFEELQYSSESIDETRHPRIYIGKIARVPASELALALRELAVAGSSDDIRAYLGSFLPEAIRRGAGRRWIPRDPSLPKSLRER